MPDAPAEVPHFQQVPCEKQKALGLSQLSTAIKSSDCFHLEQMKAPIFAQDTVPAQGIGYLEIKVLCHSQLLKVLQKAGLNTTQSTDKLQLQRSLC